MSEEIAHSEKAEDRAKSLFRDIRLAYLFLERYMVVCERNREYYLKRFHDSGDVLTNERAKADSCQQEFFTIFKWLERNKAYKTSDKDVVTLADNYERTPTIQLKE